MKDRNLEEDRKLWHMPVMAGEVVAFLITRFTRTIVDCTLGTGGHARAMIEAAPADAILLGLDLDEDALALAREQLLRFGDRVILEKMNFKDIGTGLPDRFMGKVDALLIDCGISTLQIVKPDRGFSFDRSGQLDMRFDKSASTTAMSVLAKMDIPELGRLISHFGQKTGSRRIAKAIIQARDSGGLVTTADLASAVKSVVRGRAAKSLARVFLAIRSRVNREMDNLSEALESLPQVLASGGRAVVIAYHGTEDRVVKQYFRKFSGRCICPPGRVVCNCGAQALFRVLTPKPVTPSAEETRRNPSARSARIRVVEKM
jgi:16S rRNA (cytosine1402-N4)-methyltransferase